MFASFLSWGQECLPISTNPSEFFQFKLQSAYLKFKCLCSLLSFSLYTSSPPWGISFPLPVCSFLFSEHPRFTTIHVEQFWDSYIFVHFNSCDFLCFMHKVPVKLNNFIFVILVIFVRNFTPKWLKFFICLLIWPSTTVFNRLLFKKYSCFCE